jgi:UDP-N-acetylmuramate dehydrogenase
MKDVKKIKDLKNKLTGKISFDESLSKFSWFNLGGPAKVIFRPKNLNEMSFFLKKVDYKKKIQVIGVGSNTLIRDGGYDGIIIKLGKSFSHLSLLNPSTIIAGASALDKQVSNYAFENLLSGFEFLSCIPGSIGGAIRMNSGCYDEDISKLLISVQAMDFNGNLKIFYLSDIKFSYRSCNLDKNLIFISATFKGKKSSKLEIKKKMINLINKKSLTQPSKIKTCGSTFKNPKNNKAWKLIKDSECEGMNIGDAYISTKHCNFFVNKGNASSKDLENLIIEVQKNVFKKTGINLEPEVQIIGKKI